MIHTEKELFDYIWMTGPWEAIVVEGYDGVGKGRVLSFLNSIMTSVEPYRPDYNLWQQYDHRQIDRWKVSGFFWDVYSHFMKDRRYEGAPMLFDRGVISGAVYNDDESIALNYKKLLRGIKVLHVLVTCREEDYYNFADVRDSISPMHYAMCQEYTARYKHMLNLSGVEYITYENHYDEELAKKLSETCEGCGHYNYGVCRHPKVNNRVSKDELRCQLSTDKEVQDINDNEMQCV